MNPVGLTSSVSNIHENLTAVELTEPILITGLAAPAEGV